MRTQSDFFVEKGLHKNKEFESHFLTYMLPCFFTISPYSQELDEISDILLYIWKLADSEPVEKNKKEIRHKFTEIYIKMNTHIDKYPEESIEVSDFLLYMEGLLSDCGLR